MFALIIGLFSRRRDDPEHLYFALHRHACQLVGCAEIETLRPQVIVLLGATAAQALLGKAFRVSAHRGQLLHLSPETQVPVEPEPVVAATVHPSAVLRDRDNRDQAYKLFVDDLRSVRAAFG